MSGRARLGGSMSFALALDDAPFLFREAPLKPSDKRSPPQIWKSGDRLADKYVLRAELGRGGMGTFSVTVTTPSREMVTPPIWLPTEASTSVSPARWYFARSITPQPALPRSAPPSTPQ